MTDEPLPRAFYEADSLSTEIYDARAASIIPGSSVEGDTSGAVGARRGSGTRCRGSSQSCALRRRAGGAGSAQRLSSGSSHFTEPSIAGGAEVIAIRE